MDGAASGGLAGRTILVAGATGALGGAVVRLAAAGGARVVATGRNAARLAEVVAGLGTPPAGEGATGGAAGGAGGIVADLATAEGRASLAEAVPELDGFVFAAGRLRIAPWRLEVEARWREAHAANLEAPLWTTRELLRRGRFREGASLVFLSSVAGVTGAAGHAGYGADKAALVAWARALALEVAPRRMRVNCVSPGMVETPMAADAAAVTEDALAAHAAAYPLGLGRPADVAAAVAFLLGDGARWITGQNIVVDGGFTIR